MLHVFNKPDVILRVSSFPFHVIYGWIFGFHASFVYSQSNLLKMDCYTQRNPFIF